MLVTQLPLPIQLRFPCQSFTTCVDYDASWCVNLSEQFMIFYGTWDGGSAYKCRCFSFPTVVAASELQFYTAYLKKKGVYNCGRVQANQITLFALYTCFFIVIAIQKINMIWGLFAVHTCWPKPHTKSHNPQFNQQGSHTQKRGIHVLILSIECYNLLSCILRKKKSLQNNICLYNHQHLTVHFLRNKPGL